MDHSDWQIILDQPAKSPQLGFDRYANAFADIVHNSPPRFAIGIFGGWGSGKTTLMERIRHKLKPNKNIVKVDFSAWRYEKEDHLIIPLLDSIQAALDKWLEDQGGNDEKIESLIKTIGQVAYSITAGLSFKAGLGDALSVSVDANKMLMSAKNIKEEEEKASVPKSSYFASFRALSLAFETFAKDDPARRIVVFIDDLDRCLPKGALSVLESMKLFFDLDGFVFIVGLDKDVIAWSIDSIYKTAAREGDTDAPLARPIEGADYIKKIFQVPFELRPVSSDNVEDLVNSMALEARLPQTQKDVLIDDILPHLRYLVSEGGGINPRDVKRYINNFTMASKTRDPAKAFDSNVFLTLQTLATIPEWQFVYDAFRGSRDMFRLALDHYLSDANDAREALRGYDPAFSALPPLLEEYLRAPNLGNPLVKTETLADYLEIGASSLESSEDLIREDFARAIANLRSLRIEILDLPLDPSPENGELTELSDKFSHVHSGMASNLPTWEFQKLQADILEVDRLLGFRFPEKSAQDTTGNRLPETWKEDLGKAFLRILTAVSYYVNVVRRRPEQFANTMS